MDWAIWRSVWSSLVYESCVWVLGGDVVLDLALDGVFEVLRSLIERGFQLGVSEGRVYGIRDSVNGFVDRGGDYLPVLLG